MKILNLMYPEESEVKYKISRFPDGQQDIVIDIGDFKKNPNGFSIFPIQIKSRFNSFRDLELIICATKALRRLDVSSIHLHIPYLLGARSDRQFVEGGNSYLVDVIAPIINSLGFKSVTVFDVHSDVAAACINNLKVVDNSELVISALKNINEHNFLLVSPDAGALKKIYKIADAIGYKNEVIACSKSRDAEGNLSNINVPIKISKLKKDVVIIDDICDGGATFLNIGKIIKELRDGYPNTIGVPGKTYLIITHGIFSKGFKELAKYFDGIYTTDSIRSDFDWEQKERENTEICKILKL